MRRMRPIRTCCLLAALLPAVSGCATYDPPIQGDHTTQRYQTDLEKCRTTSRETVRRRNADTPFTWMASPFTGPPEVRAEIRTCMQHAGYVLEKTGS
jgi:hypothetical protein